MINNTSRQRWQRAEARQLDNQFMAAIVSGMSCSPFEAEAVAVLRRRIGLRAVRELVEGLLSAVELVWVSPNTVQFGPTSRRQAPLRAR